MLKNFTQISDVPNPKNLVKQALDIKKNPLAQQRIGNGKTIIAIFLNPSLRTRLSTEKAAQNLGMNCIVLDINKQGWALEFEENVIMNSDKPEHIKEAAKVISSYCDIIGIRSFPLLQNYNEDKSEKIISAFLKHCTVPVISLESCLRHPLQSLTDIITIEELGIKKPKITVTWAPHIRALPQAVANSFLEWSQIIDDAEITLSYPKGYELDKCFSKYAHRITNNQNEAFKNADIMYVKNWSQVRNYGKTSTDFNDWMVTKEKMDLTRNAKLMHCLPVRRNVVIDDHSLDNSIVIQQAGNRVYAAQAVIKSILEA